MLPGGAVVSVWSALYVELFGRARSWFGGAGDDATYEAGVLEALDDFGREGGGDLAVVVAVGGGGVERYL